jgi:hypothetical protein
VIVFHLSNRYFALEPVVMRLAQDAKLSYRLRDFSLTSEQRNRDEIWPSTWMVVARLPYGLGRAGAGPELEGARGQGGTPGLDGRLFEPLGGVLR